MPEFFGFAIECCAAADHRPEFPSELAANLAERPPAPQKMLPRCADKAFVKVRPISAFFEITLNLLLKRFEHARNRDEYRDSFAADRRHHIAWTQRVLKNNRSA